MTEVLSPPATTSAQSPTSESLPQPRAQSHDDPPPAPPPLNYAQHRMSEQSHTTRSSRPHSPSIDYPAFSSTLSYALVRDFAYPVFHPLHYGAALEPPSGASTPTSEWNPGRRQSDPMESHAGGWHAGPWGGDGVMYGDPEEEEDDDDDDDLDDDDRLHVAALPSTSFGNSHVEQQQQQRNAVVAPLEFGDDELVFKKGKHRKSKSYGSIADFERGRRRESARRSRESGGAADTGIFWFHGQQQQQTPENNNNDSHNNSSSNTTRMSRGRSGTGGSAESNGSSRKDSRNSTNTLPNRSFHHSYSLSDEIDPDEPIPLDAEPHSTHSPQRDSMGPEDEELFAGPSLALYSFAPENSNELRLEEGQEIMVSYRHGQGWLVASDPETGEQGLVPEAYVRLIADMPNYDPETGQFVDLEEEFDDDDEGLESSEAVDPRHGGGGGGGGWDDNEREDRGDDEIDRNHAAHANESDDLDGDGSMAVRKMRDGKGGVEGEDRLDSPRRNAVSSTFFPV